MANNNWVKYYQVKVPHRSGADRGFLRSFSGLVGVEYPVLCKHVIPSTMINVDIAHSVQLPPLATDAYANIDFNLEAFFVPTRLLYGGYEAWQTGGKIRDNGVLVSPTIPRLEIACSEQSQLNYLKPGTLADFLGYRFTNDDLVALKARSDADPDPHHIHLQYGIWKFLAYHRVINDWYLRTNVQHAIFNHNITSPSKLENLPFVAFNSDEVYYLNSFFEDGIALGSLRRRNFGSDYFTEAFVSAQAGVAPSIDIGGTFPVVNSIANDNLGDPFYLEGSYQSPDMTHFNLYGNDDSDTGKVTQSVTIQRKLTLSVIRALNSITQYAERNNLPSPRMQDWVKAQYGANLDDGVAQRAMYLGSASFNVYSKSVEQNAPSPSGAGETRNPFESVGAQYGKAFSTGQKHLVDHFTAQEPGYIVVLACLTPKVRYSTGVNKDNLRFNRQLSQVDMPNPILQNTGYEPVYKSELSAKEVDTDSVFGYTDKYADEMISVDEINGLIRDGESLSAFALQRGFADSPAISNEFLQIPSGFLDDILAVSSAASGFDYWCDMYVDFKVSHPLQQYSIPTLQDPAYEHGKSVVVRRNGSRID